MRDRERFGVQKIACEAGLYVVHRRRDGLGKLYVVAGSIFLKTVDALWF